MDTLPAGSSGQPDTDPPEGGAATDGEGGEALAQFQSGRSREETAQANAREAPGIQDAACSSTQDDASRQAISTDLRAVARMARLRHLVRKEGMDAEAAAREVGVDPIIAQLWLHLPDDLWPSAGTDSAATDDTEGKANTGAVGCAARAGEARAQTSRSGAVKTLPPSSAPAPGLRRVLICRIPSLAFDRLSASGTPLLAAVDAALEKGLKLPRPDVAYGSGRLPRRPLAVPVAAEAYAAIMELARDAFNNDPRDAAGWLIACGLGLALPLPTLEELHGTPEPAAPAVGEKAFGAGATGSRFVVPPRRRPEPRAPLPADDSAPSGDELRSRRATVGISQRDLAAASGLSRGLVAEVERGRRRHVLTRLRLAETLAALQSKK